MPCSPSNLLLLILSVCFITPFTANFRHNCWVSNKKEFQWKNLPDFSTVNTDGKKRHLISLWWLWLVWKIVLYPNCHLSFSTISFQISYRTSVWKKDNKNTVIKDTYLEGFVFVLFCLGFFSPILFWGIFEDVHKTSTLFILKPSFVKMQQPFIQISMHSSVLHVRRWYSIALSWFVQFLTSGNVKHASLGRIFVLALPQTKQWRIGPIFAYIYHSLVTIVLDFWVHFFSAYPVILY